MRAASGSELRHDRVVAVECAELGGGKYGRENFFWRVDDGEMHVEAGADEGLAFHVREQVEKGCPEAVDVGDNNGFAMPAELRPRQLFDQFFERPNAAWKSDEGIRAFKHEALAHVHVLDHDQLIDVLEHLFLGAEELWDDACDLAASAEAGARDFAHEAQASAPINKANTVVGQGFAELPGGDGVGRVEALAGAAVDADAFHGSGC